jgi:hypothetical protein
VFYTTVQLFSGLELVICAQCIASAHGPVRYGSMYTALYRPAPDENVGLRPNIKFKFGL